VRLVVRLAWSRRRRSRWNRAGREAAIYVVLAQPRVALAPWMRLVTKPASRTMRKWWEKVDLLSSSPASCMTWVHKDPPSLKTARSTPRGSPAGLRRPAGRPGAVPRQPAGRSWRGLTPWASSAIRRSAGRRTGPCPDDRRTGSRVISRFQLVRRHCAERDVGERQAFWYRNACKPRRPGRRRAGPLMAAFPRGGRSSPPRYRRIPGARRPAAGPWPG